MKEQLTQYVNLLFAGAPDSNDIREEILQNTLERYDDLISQGKQPEAAYQLAISGIGDINEILGTSAASYRDIPNQTHPAKQSEEKDDSETRTIKAWAVGLYICSPIPLFILSEFGLSTLGLCLTLLLIAAATVRMVMIRKNDTSEPIRATSDHTPAQEWKKAIGGIILGTGVALYFLVSFLTHAWYITWVIFPLCGCIRGLVNAIIDLKEANKYEI